MPINIRNTLLRTGFDSDHHYNDLQDNEILTKQQFSSGVHEVISDPLSNTNATREFYQLSILTKEADAGSLIISDSGMFNVATVDVPDNASDSEVTILIVAKLEADSRFTNVIRDVNTINFNTVGRGRDSDNDLLILTDGAKADTGSPTNIKWRIDVLQEASDANVHSEIILDAGIWTGI